MHRTKIVATLGPATSSPERIRALIDAGMSVARINMSHGSHAEHAERIAIIREQAQRAGRAVAILLDLQGPKIRTGSLVGGGPVALADGATFTITSRESAGTAERVSTTYTNLPGDVRPGDRILISDGLLELRVVSTTDTDVVTTVVHGGSLRERQGINLPGVAISCPAVTPKDVEDLAFGLDQEVDYVAISFVRRAQDVSEVKAMIAEAGKDTPVIAKLEKPEAVNALDEIIDASDGVMVARGDMGVELSPEQVPGVQKRIVQKANLAAIPVITATQMLESMIHNPQPTRAEVSDVANAILDGSDAVMLSGETAIGKFPVRAVQMMGRIANVTEADLDRDPNHQIQCDFEAVDLIPEAIGAAVHALQQALDIKAVSVLTKTGSSARFMARFRSSLPVLGITPFESTYRRMCLYYGVIPYLTPFAHTEDVYYRQVEDLVVSQEYAKPGETIIVTGGHPIVQGGPTNFLKVLVVGS